MFFTALRIAYKSDPLIFQLIEKKDALNPYDGLNLEDINSADSIANILIIKIPPPSMCETCSSGENYFMAITLHYYNSKDLDILANKFYKMHNKKDKMNGF